LHWRCENWKTRSATRGLLPDPCIAV